MGFSFFKADALYCDFLRKEDPRVPYVMDEKSTRPFVGIVLSVNGFHYYAPLTSPKRKHLKMKSQIDFLKIKRGEWGAINLNNMIPVPPECLQKVELAILETDSKVDIAYKYLLRNQLSWCNANRDMILKQARKLYRMVIDGRAWESLASRCCNFALDEQRCAAYCREHSLSSGECVSDRRV